MRLRALFVSDIRIQYKYGFYLLYLFFTVFYVAVLSAFPSGWREKAAIIMIFTDPAAMGLYFMGAMVLFEKSERVLNTLAVSPLKPAEYVLSKLLSLSVISMLTGLVIALAARLPVHPILLVVSLFLCSCLFSAAGLITACKISTLNQFVLATVPAEILICLPAILWLFGYDRDWLLFHPGAALMAILSGNAVFPVFILLLWTAFMTVLACSLVGRMLKSVGGVKL